MTEVVSTEERELILKFKTAKENLARVTSEKSEAEKIFEAVKGDMIDYLVSRGQKSSAKYDGIGQVSLNKPTIRAYVLKENEESLFEFLRANNYGSVIKPTLHPSTMNAVVGEMLRNGIKVPEYVNIDEVRVIRFLGPAE